MVRRPGGAVPLVQMAFHAPTATHPDFFPLLFLDGVLSGFKGPGVFGGEPIGARSSRLYRALVERELAVEAGSAFRPSLDPTVFEVGATLRPGVAPERVEAAILEELDRVSGEPVGEEELEKIRKQARAQWVYMADGVSQQAVLLGSTEVVAGEEFLTRFWDRLSAVTPEAMQRVAAQTFAGRNRTVGWYIPEAGNGSAVAGDA